MSAEKFYESLGNVLYAKIPSTIQQQYIYTKRYTVISINSYSNYSNLNFQISSIYVLLNHKKLTL